MSEPAATTSRETGRAAAARRGSLLESFLVNGGIVLLFLAIALIATAIAEPRFLNRLNLINVMRNFSLLLIPSLAQMLVMTAGGVDLSVGATVALSSVVTASVMAMGAAWFPGADALLVLVALSVALGTGALIGLTNATLIARYNLSPFMVTLAMMSILMGIALYFTQGIPVYGVVESFVDGVGRGSFLGLPIILHLAVLLLIAVVILQRFTAAGRHIYAVGSDYRSARLSSVPTVRTLVIAYVLAGMLSAFTGFLMTSRLGSGQATIGSTLALETIAAAVIGGVSLRGGVGRAELVAPAALFLAVIANAMNLLKIDSKFQTLVLGVVLIVALAIERLLLRRRHA